MQAESAVIHACLAKDSDESKLARFRERLKSDSNVRRTYLDNEAAKSAGKKLRLHWQAMLKNPA